VTYPATPLQVEWDRLDPRQFEDMVSLLLAVLHPTSVRTDGAGGDGGRDVHVEGDGGDEVFELKSFTGRLTGSRRRQVKQSFRRAMVSKPAAWTLVVPIDLNPAEQKWFRELAAGAPTTCRWHGKTWLDARMAENPCVPRYCLSDVTNEVRELAIQLGAEKAALANGVPDAVERLRALQALANEVDPFYYVDLATDGARGTVSVSLRPRFPTAAREAHCRGGLAGVPGRGGGRGGPWRAEGELRLRDHHGHPR
jgi:hypothetical protein